MDRNTIFIIIGLIWAIGLVIFAKDYFFGERKIERQRAKGRPKAGPSIGYGAEMDAD